MTYWDVEERGGIAVAKHNNPPMNYLVAGGTAELAKLIAKNLPFANAPLSPRRAP